MNSGEAKSAARAAHAPSRALKDLRGLCALTGRGAVALGAGFKSLGAKLVGCTVAAGAKMGSSRPAEGAAAASKTCPARTELRSAGAGVSRGAGSAAAAARAFRTAGRSASGRENAGPGARRGAGAGRERVLPGRAGRGDAVGAVGSAAGDGRPGKERDLLWARTGPGQDRRSPAHNAAAERRENPLPLRVTPLRASARGEEGCY